MGGYGTGLGTLGGGRGRRALVEDQDEKAERGTGYQGWVVVGGLGLGLESEARPLSDRR